jgi:hypothetical protein
MMKSRNVLAVVITVGVLSQPLTSTAFAARGEGRRACRADVQKLCPDAKPGGGEIRKCLQDHKDELSDACKEAIARRHARRHEKSSSEPGASETPASDAGSADDAQ